MTTYEVAALAESIGANFLTTFTIIVSLTTTYVIAAFAAGARLSRFQLVVVNVSFVTAASVIGFLSLQMFQRATVMAQKTATEFDAQLAPRDVSWIIALLYFGLVAAALAFMANVRRPGGGVSGSSSWHSA